MTLTSTKLRITAVDDITLSLSRVAEQLQSKVVIEMLIQQFNQYGCVLLDCGPDSDLRSDLLALRLLFGSPMLHRSSDQDGVVTITPVEGSTYTALTNQSFTFHTDGSFMQNPPKVFALQCEVPSQRGGLSQLIQAEFLYEELMQREPDSLPFLFDHDAINISTIDGEISQAPVFRRIGDRVGITFRPSDHQVTVTPKPEAKQAFESLQEYVETDANQVVFKMDSNQILVMDNLRLLHNRTPFPEGESPKRRMYRLWFDGVSEFDSLLNYGFSAN